MRPSLKKQPSPAHCSLGTAIRTLRGLRGMLQADLARAIGTDAGTMSRIETGQREPSLAQLRAVAAALGVRAGELIDSPADLSGSRPAA